MNPVLSGWPALLPQTCPARARGPERAKIRVKDGMPDLNEGAAAADFSRIRNADLGRFTLDRPVPIINRLGARVEVRVRVRAVRRVGMAVTED